VTAVLLVVTGGAVSQAAIARTAELAAGAPVTVVGLSQSEASRTVAASPWHPQLTASGTEPEQVRRTVALAMSVLEDTGVMAMGHIVTGPPARAVARMARARGARLVILDPGAGAGGLMAELRRRMYGSGIVVLAETDRRGGWVSA
jgi:Universal stress protein family